MTDEQMGEMERFFGVIADGLRGEIRRVAEGHDVIRQEMEEFREEVRSEFNDVRSLIKCSYADLDAGHAIWAGRVERLERGAGHS